MNLAAAFVRAATDVVVEDDGTVEVDHSDCLSGLIGGVQIGQSLLALKLAHESNEGLGDYGIISPTFGAILI